MSARIILSGNRACHVALSRRIFKAKLSHFWPAAVQDGPRPSDARVCRDQRANLIGERMGSPSSLLAGLLWRRPNEQVQPIWGYRSSMLLASGNFGARKLSSKMRPSLLARFAVVPVLQLVPHSSV